jgi:Enoyl-CoA hydratase/isomerase
MGAGMDMTHLLDRHSQTGIGNQHTLLHHTMPSALAYPWTTCKGPRESSPAESALELLWSGDFISAEEAERIGLLSKVFDDDKLMDETYAFAERLANGPSIAIRLTKQAVYQCLRMDFLTALESITGPMGVAASTEDHREAVAAFKAKRPPQFKGI